MEFMDLEKLSDRIDRIALWPVFTIYGIGRDLLKGIQSFYSESRACVKGD